MVIILDAVRWDVAIEYLWPAVCGKLIRVRTPIDWTLAFYEMAKPWIESFPGTVSLMTCGWGQKAEVKCDRGPWGHMFPLRDNLYEIIRELIKLSRTDGNSLLVVHDFFIHNYFDDIGGLKSLTPANQNQAWGAYLYRVESILPSIVEAIKAGQTHGFEVFLTADHGEAFWEKGSQCHHGNCCRDADGISAKEVQDIFLLKVGEEFTGIKADPQDARIIQKSLFEGGPI